MLPKADLGAWGRVVLRSLIAGGCWLGGAVILSMGDPLVIVGGLATALLIVGGVVRALTGTPLASIAVAAMAVILARVTAGPAAAAAAVVLLSIGAFLRVGLRDTAVGLAAFSAAVSLLGGASPRLLFAFWALGAVTMALAHPVRSVWRRIHRRPLAAERTHAARLDAES